MMFGPLTDNRRGSGEMFKKMRWDLKGKKRENIDNDKDIFYSNIRTDAMINNQNWKDEQTINQANKIGTNEEKY